MSSRLTHTCMLQLQGQDLAVMLGAFLAFQEWHDWQS